MSEFRLSEIKLFVLDMAGTTVSGTFEVHDSLIKAFKENGYEINRTIAGKSIAVPKPLGISIILKEIFQLESKQLTSDIHDAFLIHINNYYLSSPEVCEMEGSSNYFGF